MIILVRLLRFSFVGFHLRFDFFPSFFGVRSEVGINHRLLLQFGFEELKLRIQFVYTQYQYQDDDSPFGSAKYATTKAIEPTQMNLLKQFREQSGNDIQPQCDACK